MTHDKSGCLSLPLREGRRLYILCLAACCCVTGEAAQQLGKGWPEQCENRENNAGYANKISKGPSRPHSQRNLLERGTATNGFSSNHFSPSPCEASPFTVASTRCHSKISHPLVRQHPANPSSSACPKSRVVSALVKPRPGHSFATASFPLCESAAGRLCQCKHSKNSPPASPPRKVEVNNGDDEARTGLLEHYCTL